MLDNGWRDDSVSQMGGWLALSACVCFVVVPSLVDAVETLIKF